MGFWLVPEPEAYRRCKVFVPRYDDLHRFVEILNYCENAKLFTGMPGLSSPSFDIEIDKDLVRDLFRCESLTSRSRWIMVVMDEHTRRIIGLAVCAGAPDGPTICRMLGEVLGRAGSLPKSLCSDHDPLFEFHCWQANLRILEIVEVKTVPDVPISHPFVERLIGTMRRELLDEVPFWTKRDLEHKLADFAEYFDRERAHRSLGGETPIASPKPRAPLDSIPWQDHCRGLYQLPAAA